MYGACACSLRLLIYQTCFYETEIIDMERKNADLNLLHFFIEWMHFDHKIIYPVSPRVAQSFAFVVFRYPEDAEEAVRDRNGRSVLFMALHICLFNN